VEKKTALQWKLGHAESVSGLLWGGTHAFGHGFEATASVGNIATTWTVQSTHADWRKQAWVVADLVARVRPFSITGEEFGYRKSTATYRVITLSVLGCNDGKRATFGNSTFRAGVIAKN
jgi:hypothetical protein